MNHILTLLSLYFELIVCIVAASVLGLAIGWMMSKSTVKKRMSHSVETWEQRYKALEESSAADTENLEEQLQEIAGELRTLKATNRVLTDSIKKHDATIQTARAEAIELNRQHAEMQERLQRVIQQKEKEMAGLKGLTSTPADLPPVSGSTYTALAGAAVASDSLAGVFSDDSDDTLEATLPENMVGAFDSDGLTNPLADIDLNTADTIAIAPADVFDATVQMSAEEFLHQSKKNVNKDDSDFDDFIEETANITGLFMDEMEESTVALDEESLDFAKRPYSISNAD
ncbi:MAG: hypothetical protein AB8B84_08890 [Granulosicoccus sp.]